MQSVPNEIAKDGGSDSTVEGGWGHQSNTEMLWGCKKRQEASKSDEGDL